MYACHLAKDEIRDMSSYPYRQGLGEFVKHLLAGVLRLFGITIKGVGPFGMLNQHLAMEDVTQNNGSLLALCH